MLQNLSLCLSLFSCGALEIPDVWASRFETVSLAEVEKMTLLRSAHSDDQQTQCSACACLSLRALECVCARKHRPACNAYACVMNASTRNANAGARARASCSGSNCNSCCFQAEPFACCVLLLTRACDNVQ